MSSLSKKLARKQAAHESAQRLQKSLQDRSCFDPTKVLITDIESVKLSAEDNTLTVTMRVPVGHNEALGKYEEVLDFDDDLPGYVEDAARQLFAASLRAVRERALTDRDNPCETCGGSCCGIRVPSIMLTQEDVDILTAAGHYSEETVEMFDVAAFSGHVGEFKLALSDLGVTSCPYLRPWGCAIYEHRPRACREFSPWTCDIMDLDEQKIAKAIVLGEDPERR
jgi:Fe-S-cluster containining protein